MSNKNFPLIVEDHPRGYKGYEFITLIHYNDKKYLNIVDNITKKHIVSYVLDLCPVNGIDENAIIDIAFNWYTTSRELYPISIEFSKLGISEQTRSILKLFSIDFVTRVIGPLPTYNMQGPSNVRKRKRKPIPQNMQFTIKPLSKSND